MKDSAMSNYWTESSGSFSTTVKNDLDHEQKEVWLDLLNQNRPSGGHLHILDAGCGPGFFSVMMAQQGHKITAIDFSDGMLEQASQNAAMYGVKNHITFMKMDAQEPTFEDNAFDMVMSRNITWIFTKPKEAYINWLRILKPGGRFLNFDGNWYMHLFDEELMKKHIENLERAKKLGFIYSASHSVTVKEQEDMMKNLPLSGIMRPDWDIKTLNEIGNNFLTIIKELPRNVMNEIYATKNEHTPMFMVCAEKL